MLFQQQRDVVLQMKDEHGKIWDSKVHHAVMPLLMYSHSNVKLFPLSGHSLNLSICVTFELSMTSGSTGHAVHWLSQILFMALFDTIKVLI